MLIFPQTANTVFGEVARSSDNEEGPNSSAEDSDEEHGEMEVDDVEGVPGPSSQPSSGHGGRRPPTALELRGIKDAADLYRSSSFKLQVRTKHLLNSRACSSVCP